MSNDGENSTSADRDAFLVEADQTLEEIAATYDRLKAELEGGAVMDERTRRWIMQTGQAIEIWRRSRSHGGDRDSDGDSP